MNTAHGAFAVVMNARGGLGLFGSTGGPAQRLHRWFWDAVFNPAQPVPRCYGAANHYSKEQVIPHLADPDQWPGIRWQMYETNLFGDPSLPVQLPASP